MSNRVISSLLDIIELSHCGRQAGEGIIDRDQNSLSPARPLRHRDTDNDRGPGSALIIMIKTLTETVSSSDSSFLINFAFCLDSMP